MRPTSGAGIGISHALGETRDAKAKAAADLTSGGF